MIKYYFAIIIIAVNTQYCFSGNGNDSLFKQSGKVWGLAFGDYFYKTGGDSLPTVLEYSKYKKDYNAFEFRRIHLGYDYNISENFVTSFVLSYEGEDLTSDSKRAVFVKDAFLKWKNIFTNSDLTFGLMPTPGFTFISEKVWGFRSVDKTIMDMRGVLSSRDIGLMLNGTFDKDKNYGYYVMVGNGRGVRLETNKYKRVYGSLFANFLNKKIIVDVFGDYEAAPDNHRTTFQSFVGYVNECMSAGAEYYSQKDKDVELSKGVSLFVSGKVLRDKLKMFARYDYYNPNKPTGTGFNQHFVTAGLEFSPAPKVHISPNIWINAYEGVAIAPFVNVPNRKSDVVPRLTLFYEYR